MRSKVRLTLVGLAIGLAPAVAWLSVLAAVSTAFIQGHP